MNLLQNLSLSLLIFSLTAPLLAQSDPAARDHAWTLYAVFLECSQSQDPANFIEAVERDPLMSKRAFVSALEYARENEHSNPDDARGAVIFCGWLAHYIGQIFNDPVPNEIIEGIKQNLPKDVLYKKTEDYARTLYSEPSSDKSP